MHTLNFQIPVSPSKITHKSKISLLGSCFSDEINKKFRYYAFDCSTNPFGTVFHPLILSRFIQESIAGVHNERIVQRDDVFLSWDASSSFYSMEKEDLMLKLTESRRSWTSNLEKTDFLIITFGTAWGYILDESGEMVANCHKFPSGNFTKVISKKEQLYESWKKTIAEIHGLNPDVKIIFTVSPVRHVRDGLVENNRSKAILIETIADLSGLPNCSYFPSYEIVMDELRDYRYFTQDLVHPNELAINYVWERFSNVWMNEETFELNKKIEMIRMIESHRSIHPESESARKNLQSILHRKSTLFIEHPELLW